MNEIDKIKLTGRIYPAIQNCVANRYKIIAGYFAIVGFLVVNPKFLKAFVESYALLFISFIFAFFVAHNFCNYWNNAKEQWEIENLGNRFPKMEAIFGTIMLVIILGGYCLLINYEPA